MQHARYVGKREDLLGRTALVRRGMVEGEVLAQFDFPVNHPKDEHGAPKEPQTIPECFDWHCFSKEEFMPTEDILNEVTPL